MPGQRKAASNKIVFL